MGSSRRCRYSGAVLVFCGGTLGTLLRYLIDAASVRVSDFALDIFIINVVGAFILAALVGYITGAGEPTRDQLKLRLFLGTGMMGGFTTYSTLAVEVALAGFEQLVAAGRELSQLAFVRAADALVQRL